jgi:hypothetical protein
MVLGGAGGHTHMPSATAMSEVQRAMNNTVADASHPQPNHHTHLHYFPTSDSIPENKVLSLNAPGTLLPTCTGPDAVSFYTLKAAHFPSYLAPAYHYAVFGHFNTCDSSTDCAACPATAKSAASPPFGTSGLAELPGNDLIVSLGPLVDLGVNPMPDIINEGTFMHELGHNISLRHGGGDDLVQKPNYFSVLNYSYQYGIGQTAAPGPYATSTNNPSAINYIDYSIHAAGTLQEGVTSGVNTCISDGSGGMSEPAGITFTSPGDLDVTVFYTNFGGTTDYAPSNGTAVDWDGTPPATDLNVYGDVNGDGLCSVLTGHNDWVQSIAGPVYQDTNFALGFQCNTGNWVDGAKPPSTIEDRELTGQQIFDRHQVYPFLHIQIEVRPGHIQVGSLDVVHVAALGSATFDVTRVVPSSLRFANSPPLSTSIRDVNHDGFNDIVAGFSMKNLNLSPASTVATLIGALKSSQAFGGTAPVTVVHGDRDHSGDDEHSGGHGDE